MRMAVKVGLLLSTLHADDDIPQHLAAVVLVHIVFAIHPQRETQHISGHGLVAVLVVQLTYVFLRSAQQVRRPTEQLPYFFILMFFPFHKHKRNARRDEL